ncbi:McrB family protein [Cyclobacterium xiamenense]|uniref:McrB family protein n=1 Tax=Cyclobacterium xiamenense TaxID=1297121 RepID=UPI0035CEE8A5
MKYWIEKTIVNGREDRIEGDRALGKALWSPQKDRRGADIYKNMREVRQGDIIIHLVNNSKIAGVSKVRKSAVESHGISGTEWDGPAYLIELEDYEEINPEISRNSILSADNKTILDKINSQSEVFYNNKLELRQGAYLTPCPKELLTLINRAYLGLSNGNLPHILTSDLQNIDTIEGLPFNRIQLLQDIRDSGLWYSDELILRLTGSLLTKPFVILTGLSGSGKTKLAQAFVQWICKDQNQYRIIPVGADWTNREPLLGYPNALKPGEYVKPDNGVLDLILLANNRPDSPHFLILDEMNLSHVERYFADFLSVMESDETIPLYSEGTSDNELPNQLSLPSNLFIIGTVNIDETTNMFSPKVLDRANTIEFRVTQDEMKKFLDNIKNINMNALTGKGSGMAKSFLDMASSKTLESDYEINEALIQFFGELKKTGAEFGYRSATEILRLVHHLSVLDSNLTKAQKIDIAIMQKLLPKLHGSRRKLCPVLETLGTFCFSDRTNVLTEVFDREDFDFNDARVIYPLSLEKITRMYKGALDHGFASFAEA